MSALRGIAVGGRVMADGRWVRVAAGLIQRRGRLLVARRAEGGRHAGRWEFPGGKLRPGETLREALARELEEELGIRSVAGAVVDHMRYAYPGGPRIEIAFLHVERAWGRPHNRVFADLRWVPLRRLPGLDFLDADRPLVERLAGGALRLRDTAFAERRGAVGHGGGA